MHRLLPAPAGATTIDEAYAAPLDTHPDRPWCGLCMVQSIDGSTVVDGLSAGLSSDADRAVLHRMRSLADVVLVGAGTVRDEGYGAPATPGQRVGVVTNRGSVDVDTELFASGAGFVVTTEQAAIDHASRVDVLRCGSETVDLAGVMARLDQLVDRPRFVQAEGGATLNGALLDADLLDEINLTISPRAVGGDGPRLMARAGNHAHRYALAQLTVDDDSFLFTRWRRNAG